MVRIKVAFHFMDGGMDVATDMLAKVPMCMVKFAEMDEDWLNDPGKIDLLNKAKASGAIVLGRRSENQVNLDAPDMIVEANRYYVDRGPNSFTNMARNFPQVDIWEGPNEVGISDDARMIKYATLLVELARLIKVNTGKKAGLGAWAVGNPDFPLWRHWAPVLKACKDYQAVLTRHSYGPLDVWYSFRHRKDEEEFRKLGYTNTPVVITEAGQDIPKTWREIWGDDIGAYWNDYLKALDEGMEADTYVLGCQIFTAGGGGAWGSFDYAHTALADKIVGNPPKVPVPPPSGTHYVIANLLNVRQFPWSGEVVPPVVGSLTKNTQVTVSAIVKLPGMAYGWGLVSKNGNMWVSMQYLAPVIA